MAEKLIQSFLFTVFFFYSFFGLTQKSGDGNARKYYGAGGVELFYDNEIDKQKVLVISQEGYRNFSHLGKVTELKANNGGRLPNPLSMKSELSELASFTLESTILKMGAADHGDFLYSRNIGEGRPIKSGYSTFGIDSITGSCDVFGNLLSYNLALAGLVDTSDSFFSDAQKKLQLNITIEKLIFQTCLKPSITKAESIFYIEIADVYGAKIYSDRLNIYSNIYEGGYAYLKLDDLGCDKDLETYSRRGFLIFDIFQALAYEISHSEELLEIIKNRSQQLANVESQESLLIKRSLKQSQSVGQLLEAVVTIQTDNGHGSGCIISEDGYIISNHHVAGVKSNKLEVIMNDGVKYLAEVIRTDAYSDLTLIKVNTDRKFKFLNPNQDSKVSLGDKVRVIGTPADPQLGQTLTAGIVSNLRKNNKLELIQTDAHISPGNSGGALVNAKGELVGIVSSKAMGIITEGIGFAIPVKYINERLKVNFE
jgi:hypothetical protein